MILEDNQQAISQLSIKIQEIVNFFPTKHGRLNSYKKICKTSSTIKGGDAAHVKSEKSIPGSLKQKKKIKHLLAQMFYQMFARQRNTSNFNYIIAPSFLFYKCFLTGWRQLAFFPKTASKKKEGLPTQNRFETDVIRMRGVLAKGYGLLPKIIMTAPVLRLEAKALYAYFVSYTGSGCNRAFPSRDKILSDISLTPNTYYKYLNELIELGLISVEQKNGGSAGKGFKRNIYTVEGYSEKFIFALALHRNSTDESLILVEGVKDITAAGYGIIPKSVMTDPDLSLKAKGVYAYFCAFSGTSYVSAPYKELILYHLDIASNSYPKYIHELVKNGYIRKTRRVVNGRFSGMTYTINRDSEAGLPHTRNSDTVDMIPDTKRIG